MAVEVRLKELRSRQGISQNELARRLKMSLANIQKMEYNKAKSIPLDTLDKLCKVLECEVGELLVRVPDNDDKQEEIASTSSPTLPLPDEPKLGSTKSHKRTRSLKSAQAA
jgi:putative transcriptional regulator